MTSEAVQTMIDQALLRNSGGRDGSHSSHENNSRNMHTVRPCYYADFMKCHPLSFKGTKGVADFLITFMDVSTARPKTLDESIELATINGSKATHYAEGQF
ncbi:hypothetical protein Tco_0978616 [Tanacetum coccineum]|uniref:Uncharacterized protein n=1 Tax=Tanacetum coccineum TaxID=301880 RepID=A0ABQ5ENE2_9ASTR